MSDQVPASAISAGLDAWHVACHAEETQMRGIRRVLAAAVPHIERTLRDKIADEIYTIALEYPPGARRNVALDAACVARGSAGVDAPDAALGRCPVMIQCHLETGHQGAHEARETADG